MIQGLRQYTENENDFNLGAVIAWPKLSELTQEEFWTAPLTIKDQISDNNDDFCASCAGAGAIEPREETELFYWWLFAAAKKESGDDPDSWGLELKHIGQALVKWGIPEMKDVPKEVLNFTPSQRRRFENYLKYPELVESAKKHKQQTYFFVKNSPYDPYDTAKAVKWYFRDKKQHFIFGTKFGWDLGTYLLEGTPDGFGHALWSNGWFKEGIAAVNSAGKRAGKNGMHAMTRDTFNKYAKLYGMLVIVDLPRSEAEYAIENKITLDQLNLLTRVLIALKDLIKYINAKNIIKGFGELVGQIFSKKQD
jgi:hypothetical protein